MKTLIAAIKEADDIQVDACWAVLRDFGLGVRRKLLCWSLILDIEEESVLAESPKDENGRILDKITRHSFHDELILRSKELKEQNQ